MREPPLDAPDEEWLVWADAMQQVGDPRGELVALGAHLPGREAFIKKHADALLGRVLGRHVRKGRLRVTKWRRYLPDAIELRIDDAAEGPQLVVDLFGSPHATTLRGLAVVGVASPHGDVLDLRATIGWLRESQIPPSISSFALVDDRARGVERLVARDREPGPNLVAFGSLAELWPALPDVQHVAIVCADPGQIQFGPMRLPQLRSFTLRPLCWTPDLSLVSLVGYATWRELRALELRLPGTWYADMPDDARAYRPIYTTETRRGTETGTLEFFDWARELQPIFNANLPLERLALTSFADANSVLAALADAPPTLTELDLSDSDFDIQHAERLARMPFAWNLKRLVVERVRLASPRSLAELPAEIVHSCAPAAPTYRFQIAME